LILCRIFCRLPTQGGVEEIPQFFIISSPHRKLYTKNPWILDTQKQRGVAPFLSTAFSPVSPFPCFVMEEGCSVAHSGRCVAQHCSALARHLMEVPPTEHAAVKIWRWASVNVMNDCISVCIVKRKINIKKINLRHRHKGGDCLQLLFYSVWNFLVPHQKEVICGYKSSTSPGVFYLVWKLLGNAQAYVS
jgi:hypothetical protein